MLCFPSISYLFSINYTISLILSIVYWCFLAYGKCALTVYKNTGSLELYRWPNRLGLSCLMRMPNSSAIGVSSHLCFSLAISDLAPLIFWWRILSISSRIFFSLTILLCIQKKPLPFDFINLLFYRYFLRAIGLRPILYLRRLVFLSFFARPSTLDRVNLRRLIGLISIYFVCLTTFNFASMLIDVSSGKKNHTRILTLVAHFILTFVAQIERMCSRYSSGKFKPLINYCVQICFDYLSFLLYFIRFGFIP